MERQERGDTGSCHSLRELMSAKAKGRTPVWQRCPLPPPQVSPSGSLPQGNPNTLKINVSFTFLKDPGAWSLLG